MNHRIRRRAPRVVVCCRTPWAVAEGCYGRLRAGVLGTERRPDEDEDDQDRDRQTVAAHGWSLTARIGLSVIIAS